MRKHFFTLLIGMCISIQLFAQENKSDTNIMREDGAYLVVNQLPEFPGGMNALMKFINDNVKYPAQAQKEQISGRVIVQFVVETNGQLDKVKIIQGVHPLLDDEAIRVIKSMPLWTPGKHEGKVVPVVFNIPIKFNNTAPQKKIIKPKKVLIAGDINTKKDQLEGFWQMCVDVVPGEEEGTYMGFVTPFMKALLPDKTFQNLILNTGNGQIVITTKGKYKKISKNTYKEEISFSISDPSLTNKDVKLYFEFLNSNLMKVSFNIPGNPNLMSEYWARITQPKISVKN